MPEIKLQFSADGQTLEDDISSAYTLGRQVAHEYHSSAVQSYIEAESAAQQIAQEAAMTEMDQFKKEQAKKKAAETGAVDTFASTMVESLATRKPEATSSIGKAGATVAPEGGGGGWGDTAPEAMPSESKKIQTETSSQVEDPMIDPVMAASAGAGAAFKLSMSAGKALMPSFAAAARAGFVNAAMEHAYGTAAEVVGANNPALALPFNVLAGIGGGMAFEPMLERAITRASAKIGKAIDPALMKQVLANEYGMVGDYRGLHTAPMKDSGSPLHDLKNTYPEDIYGPKAAQYYGHYGGNDPKDVKSINIVKSFKDKPNAEVVIYRAIPKNLNVADQIKDLEQQKAYIMRMGKIPPKVDTKLERSAYYEKISNDLDELKSKPITDEAKATINEGDWVTINKDYAKEHGFRQFDEGYKIISKKVKASEIFTNGDSIHEWGYDPSGKIAKTEVSVVDDLTQPIQAFHWSTSKITGDFDFNKLGEKTAGNNPQAVESAKLGAWFTESAEPIAEGLKEANPAQLKLKNPLILTNDKVPPVDVMGDKIQDAKQWLMDEVERAGGGGKLRAELQAKGYDGIVLEDSEFNNAKSYIVFDKKQVDFGKRGVVDDIGKTPAWAIQGTSREVNGEIVWESKFAKGKYISAGGNIKNTPEEAAKDNILRKASIEESNKNKEKLNTAIEHIKSGNYTDNDLITITETSLKFDKSSAMKIEGILRDFDIRPVDTKKLLKSIEPIDTTRNGTVLYSTKDVIEKARERGLLKSTDKSGGVSEDLAKSYADMTQAEIKALTPDQQADRILSTFPEDELRNSYLKADDAGKAEMRDTLIQGRRAVVEEVNAEIKQMSVSDILKSQKGELVVRQGAEPPAPVKGGSKKSGVPAPPDMKAKSAEVLANTNPDITQEYAGNIRLWGGADLEPKFLGQIETPEDIMRVISGTDEAFQAEREVARRGTRSWADTEAEAKKYRIEDLVGRRQGQALNAEQIDNARTLLVSSSETLRGMSRVIQSGTASDIEKMDFMRAFNTHYAIQMQVAGAAAEAGRALQIFRKVAQSDAIKMGQIREFMQGSAGKVAPEMLAKAISEMETPAQVSNFVKQATRATSWDMFIEAWINGLLSGPVTHAVNMTSNALTSIWMIPERAIAAGYSQLHGGNIRGGEMAAQSFGLVEGFKDGLKLAWEALRKGESSDLMGKIENQTNRAITAENVRQLPLVSKLAPNALEEGGLAARAVDMLGEAIRIPGRLLTASDELFKSVGYRMELQTQAYRKAVEEGLEGTAMATRIREIVSNPQELAPEVHLAAINAARYQTFTAELGEGGRAVQAAANKVPGVKLIVPFIRTPTNILKFAMERTPLAPMMKSVRTDILAGGARRDTALARISMGSMAMAVTASYAAQGMITGGGPSDPALKSHLYNQGWQPYSIKWNGKYYGYGRLEPIGMMMGLAADAVEIMGEVDELEGSKIASTVVSAIAKNVTSKTWLRGLSEFVAAMDDPDRYGDKYIQQFIGTAVPTGVAQVERTISPEVSDVQGWMDKIKSRVPGYSDELPTRRNLWGEKITFNGSLGPDIVSPIFTSNEKDSKIDKELIRMKAPIRMPQRKQSIQGVTVPLDGYEYEEFVVRMNAVKIESTGKTLKKSLDYLVTKDKDYKSARDDDQRERMIKSYMNEAIEKTRNEMYETNTEIRRFVDDEHRRMAAVQ